MNRAVVLVLAGAAVAALALTAVTVLRVAADPAVQACADALAAVDQANSANQDALRALDRALLRERRHGEQATTAQLRSTQAQLELDARRAAMQLACHYDPAPDRT